MQPTLKIKEVSTAERCEICHQNDQFNPETLHCTRCSSLSVVQKSSSSTTLDNKILLIQIGLLICFWYLQVAAQELPIEKIMMLRLVSSGPLVMLILIQMANSSLNEAKRDPFLLLTWIILLPFNLSRLYLVFYWLLWG